MKSILIKVFLLLSTLESVFALSIVFKSGSTKASGLYGFSISQVAIGFLILLAGSAFAWWTWRAFFKPTWLARLTTKLETWFGKGQRLLDILFILLLFLAISTTLILAYQQPIFYHTEQYSHIFARSIARYEIFLALFNRAYVLVIWSALLFLQILLALMLGWQEILRRPGYLRFRVLYPRALLDLIIFFTLAHWIVLFLGTRIEVFIPSWHWNPYTRQVSVRDVIFLVTVASIIGLAVFAQRRQKYTGYILIAMVALGTLFQVSFGWLTPGGFETIRLKYANTSGGFYAHPVADENLHPLEVISHYDELFGNSMFPGTKPPGVILYHMAAQELANWINPQVTADGRFIGQTTLLAIISPLLAFLILPVLYGFVRRYVSPAEAYLPGFLYIVLPAIVLMPIFLDASLYPLLYLVGAWIVWQAARRSSIMLALASGVYIFLALFMSFSLLPLIPLAIMLVGLDVLKRRPLSKSILQGAKIAAGIAAGFVILWFGFRFVLHYDFVNRYQASLRWNRNYDFLSRNGTVSTDVLGQISYRPSVKQILNAAWRNNVEMATAVGFPVYLLFLSGAAATVWAFWRRKDGPLDIPLAAMGVTYLAMNLYGQVQGEVARLWAFNAPMMVLFAGVELNRRYPKKLWVIVLVLIFQMITVWLTFHFQDFFLEIARG